MFQLRVPPGNPAELGWVAKHIFTDRLGLQLQVQESARADCVISQADRTLTLANEFFANAKRSWMSSATLPKLPLRTWNLSQSPLCVRLVSPSIPILYGRAGFTLDSSGNGRLDLDVLGSAFYMLSRYEEVVLSDRDDHDRFPASASTAYLAGFLERPIIDEYVEILWAAMQRVWPRLDRRDAGLRVRVSHDVDKPSLYAFRRISQVLRLGARDLIRGRDVSKALRGPWIWANSRSKLHPADPYNTFEWIMELSEQNDLTSAFYFMCGRTQTELDGQYEIEHRSIRALLRRIKDRGHEIGLHPSYNTYKDSPAVAEEAARLRRVCCEEDIEQAHWGGRMHFLRWETPTTLYGWERAGMTYDSTLGYADRPGFRCGTCHEYQAFDPVAHAALKLRIRPLIAMDGTVISPRYLGLGVTAAAHEKFVQLKEACRAVGGNFTLLWHNSSLATPARRELYASVVQA